MSPLHHTLFLLCLAVSALASTDNRESYSSYSPNHGHSQLHNHGQELPYPKGFKPAQAAPSSVLANPNAEDTIPIPHTVDDDIESHHISSEGAESFPQGHTIHAPYPGAFSHFQKRNVAGVYECYGKHWAGPCKWTRADGGACHPRWYDEKSSMGPDQGLVCTLFKTWTCQGDGLDGFRAPGIDDYVNNGWLNQNGMHFGPLSYRCRWG